jgi:hypothetical protein
MSIKKIAAAALFALAPFAAQAALTTLPAGWPPAGSSGLQGVQFNVVDLGNGAFVALGAHGYKNSASLANDGTSTFQANAGTYAPDGKNYANWSFDFAYSTGGCTTCNVFLQIDTNPGAGTNFVNLFDLTTLPSYTHLAGVDSWNMDFITALTGYNFNPNAASSTGFRLNLVNNNPAFAGVSAGTSEITVNVPEPGTISLAGLALAGMALLRRRRKN